MVSQYARPFRCAIALRRFELCAGAIMLVLAVGMAATMANVSGRQSTSAIPKFIGLLRVDDPDVLRASVREGAFVTETVQVFDVKLERAVGL